jgi:putative photosynthetic complex assembly protein
LHFEDGPQHTIVVRDAASLQEITRWSGERGFERGVLRTFSRARRQRGMDAGPPFELLGRADGRLTLLDTATGERVDLESFGPTNARVFAELLRTQ